MVLRISLIHWGKTFGQGHKPVLWVCRHQEYPQLQAAVTREFKDATANRVNCKCLEANPTIWSFDKGQLRQRRTVRGISSGLPAARTRATRGFGKVGAKKYFSDGWFNHQCQRLNLVSTKTCRLPRDASAMISGCFFGSFFYGLKFYHGIHHHYQNPPFGRNIFSKKSKHQTSKSELCY